MLATIIGVFTFVSSGVFIAYVCAIVVPFLGRKRAPAGSQADFSWHFFVPCRDEEAVIGDTVRRLRRTFPDPHVWVIDDDSRDATAQIVRSLASGESPDPFVHLVSRRPPHARTGKGDALNSAYQQLATWLGRHEHWEKVIVGVVDADGVLAPDCLDVCAAGHLFGDSSVGAVQLEVRMLNRHTPPSAGGRWQRWAALKLVQLQDMEFRTAISAVQHSRAYAGTVAMGGNGQFTRMSALRTIDRGTGQPWRGLLLEDYELGLHLLMAGWRTAATSDSYVSQEGLYSLRRFVTQRTRWGQGTMQCARYLPSIWRSSHFSELGVIEASYYLIQPWLQLIGAVVYPVPVALLLGAVIRDPAMLAGAASMRTVFLLLLFVAISTGPFVVWGIIYQFRCIGRPNLLAGIGYGLAFTLYVGLFYVTSLRAVYRMMRGRHGWAKTRRNAESFNQEEVAVEA
ncbi:cellulose synthase/poly-beta-1,6-N-acetylglucosamine synthase-like glycosyltransferase [Amycolatopsis echigonensis]|uniref:Cellulose synthase/poly-beta-1,6-N-acetylglucosamine synthase-like glycosyltransferase n=1 Tax=Amycolatopsis echigonensis TaxID=2576905 RepID=A0A2N3WNG8_9PSEU|nr:glycosyltransferase family 2 protein [Amycolatopsis niigatensis]PKV95416.1 cellulose synthase/poly-beta-1,6-N-acetylglucosamine synthase-like glycosyltransferase [Amycolatopsis niigatensis]